MTIEQRVAVLEEIFAKLQDYYTSAYSGEEIDARLASAGVPIGITKEYKSVAEMNQDFTGTDVKRGQFVLILPDSTASADYGKVYLKGTANWVYAFTLTTLTSIKGPIGPPGKKGDKGDPGEAGSSFAILGYFDTLADLKAAVPNPKAGGVYGVGTAPPYNIYIWDSVHGKWVPNGNLQGPPGEQGIQGPEGKRGPEGKQGPEGPVGGSSNFVRYDAAQNLTDEQKAQARGNIGADTVQGAVLYTPQTLSDAQKAQARENIAAANGTRKAFTLDKKGWYRIATCVGVGGGILTLQHNYGSGGPSSLKFLVTLDYWVPSLKCIDTGYYSPQITNARIVHVADNTNAIDIYYNINFSHDVGVCFIQTGRDNVEMQKPSYISDSDALPNGETLLAPMEYLNPPMTLGVEYRTTERYLGKPVYVKVVDCGVAPSNSIKKVNTGLDYTVIDSRLTPTGNMYASSNDNFSIPCESTNIVGENLNIAHGTYRDSENVKHDAIFIYTTSTALTGYTVYVVLKYTKTTD